MNDAAADRRRHHQPRPYRREDRPELPRRRRWCMSTTPAAPSASRRRCCRPSGARPMPPTSAPNTPRSPRRISARRPDKKRLKLADARANAVKVDFAKTPPKKPTFLGIKSFRRLRSRRTCRIHRLDAVLPDLGIDRALSGDPRRSQESAKSRARSMTTRARCSTCIVKEKWFTAQRHDRLLAGQSPTATISRFMPTRARTTADRDLPHAAPAAGEARRPLQRRAVGFHRARIVRRARLYRRLRRHRRDRRGRGRRPLQERQ